MRPQPAARRVRPFTPSQESPAVLSDRTVGRESTLEIMVARLVDAARTENRAHTMLIGPRGSGKTHLLNVALHRARQQVDVERRLVVVRFDEDAIGVQRYTDILAEAYAGVAASGSRRPCLPEYPEREIADALGDRVLVLAIENADRIFKSLGKQGQQAFRAWVEQSQQIFVLASSPSLFKGIQDRALPWWGNFGVHHLKELSLDEGRELLIKLARESGDDELAEFLVTPKAEGRLRAINALAGGSPRVWMILSECLTVETLDELVPAVEALLEGLVPYYQQLLWDLSEVEQRLIRELADGPHHAATVQELAAACEIDQRVAASTLKRLADMRWVRADKSAELDRRHTWYRLREPLVRHHFQYRSARDQPLPLIVELLKAWYDPEERREQLIRALPGSVAERFVAASLTGSAAHLASSYADHDVAALQAAARSWLHGAESGARTREAGALIDMVISGVISGPEAALAAIEQRGFNSMRDLATATVKRMTRLPVHVSTEAKIDRLLRFVAGACQAGRTAIVLGLISAAWASQSQPKASVRRLQKLLAGADLAETDTLDFDLRYTEADLLASSGQHAAAALKFQALAERLAERERAASAVCRLQGALAIGLAGSSETERDLLTSLVPELIELFGPRSAQTLYAQIGLARTRMAAGDYAEARDSLIELLAVCRAEWGPDNRGTVEVGMLLVIATSLAGDPWHAMEQAWKMMNEDGITNTEAKVLDYLIAATFRLMLTDTNAEPSLSTDLWEGSFISTLRAAVTGDETALMRLPAEMADIVRAARAQKVPASR